MGKRGVEPLRLAALEPKSSVSAISPLARIRASAHPLVENNISQDMELVKKKPDEKTRHAAPIPNLQPLSALVVALLAAH